jgi:hypothetical protein
MSRHHDFGMFIPPNLSEMGADAAELEAALARLEKYADERREVSYKIQGRHRTLEAAKEQDSRQYAAAMRKGAKKPPEETHRKRPRPRGRPSSRARALDFLIEETRTEAHELIQRSRGEWRKQSEGSLETARDRYSAVIEELVQARGEFFATESALQWLEDPNRKHAPASGISPVVLGLDKSPGAVPRQQTQIAPILEAMRYELGQPDRRKAREAALYVVDDEKEAG